MALVSTDTSEVMREVLPDGTLHNKMVLSHRDSVNGEMETLETFEKPPKLDQDMEFIEEVMPDGSKVKQPVSMSRQVHSVQTRHESFDKSSGHKVEHYEVEEVIPNTSSAFHAGVDSDYEEEMEEKKVRSLCLEQKREEIVETLTDGTKVKRKMELSRVVHHSKGEEDAVDSRRGSIREDYPNMEVVPGTTSAFVPGQDD